MNKDINNISNKVEIEGIVKSIKKTSIYTPIIEAIVNAIQSNRIESQGINIEVLLNREKTKKLDKNEKEIIPDLISITITDNGEGFTKKNIESFATFYSKHKVSIGGKGFGRFTFLKYFTSVEIDSVIKEKKDFIKKTFNFNIKNKNFVNNLTESKELNEKKQRTNIILSGLKKEYKNDIEKKVEVVARKILEKLLVYYIPSNKQKPNIVIKDTYTEKSINLNDFLENDNDILHQGSGSFELQNGNEKTKFKYHLFKIYYSDYNSSIHLTANQRLVTSERLLNYIPDMSIDFYEDSEKTSKKYIVDMYIESRYLDDNVTNERGGFDFDNKGNMLYSYGKTEIEKKASLEYLNLYKKEFDVRKEKKEKKIKNYLKDNSWYIHLRNNVDLSNLPFNASNDAIDEEFHRAERKKEKNIIRVSKVISDNDFIEEKEVEKIASQVSEINKIKIIQHFSNRKIIIDLLKRTLQYTKDKEYPLENAIHKIFYPLNSESGETDYFDQNLWLLDEKLNFHQYLSSDKGNLGDGIMKERPDVLIFGERSLYRQEDESTNPITIIEFKRPDRNDYKNDENPILQTMEYIEKIRLGKIKSDVGNIINLSKETPAYVFIIATLTDKLRKYCDFQGFTLTSDNLGYFGYNPNLKTYFQIIDFNKIALDAEKSHKFVFKMLGIDKQKTKFKDKK